MALPSEPTGSALTVFIASERSASALVHRRTHFAHPPKSARSAQSPRLRTRV